MKTIRKSPGRILLGLLMALPAGATTIIIGDNTSAPGPADNAVHIQSLAPWTYDTPATGISVSVGAGNEAFGYFSVALGADSHAGGDHDIAIGASNWVGRGGDRRRQGEPGMDARTGDFLGVWCK